MEVSSLALSVVPQQTTPHTFAFPSLFHGPVDVEVVVVRVWLEDGGQQVTLLSHLAAITDATSCRCINFVALFVSRLKSLLTFSLVALTFPLPFQLFEDGCQACVGILDWITGILIVTNDQTAREVRSGTLILSLGS